MKIQCILKREGGTHIELRGTHYHFAPQADGRHVAEVTDEAHISRLLSIPEAYRVVADTPAAPKPAAAPIPEPTIQTPPVDPALSTGNAPWTPPPAPTDKPQGSEQQGGTLESDDGEPVEDHSELRRLLAEQYKEKFGRMPHGKWTAAKIDEELKKGQ
jgi:hypothetical protein